MKWWFSSCIGILAAGVLTFIRGGSEDFPLVPLIFAGMGFFGSLLLFWLFERQRLKRLEGLLGSSQLACGLRDVVAISTAVSLVLWSGPFIVSFGFAGWLMGLLFSIAAPLVVCLTASRWSILLGLLTATCLSASVLLENARGETWFWSEFWREDWRFWAIDLLISMGLSLIASVPIHVQRGRLNRAA